MNTRIVALAAIGSLLCASVLPVLADNQYHDKQKTRQAARNFASRKVAHADHAVAHLNNKRHRYVHRKYAHAQNWLNKH